MDHGKGGGVRKGGGVCLFIANYIPFKIISTLNIYDADIICIEFYDPTSLKPIRLINVYSPPSFKNIPKFAPASLLSGRLGQVPSLVNKLKLRIDFDK